MAKVGSKFDSKKGLSDRFILKLNVFRSFDNQDSSLATHTSSHSTKGTIEMKSEESIFRFRDEGDRIIVELKDERVIETELSQWDSREFLSKCREELKVNTTDSGCKMLCFDFSGVIAFPSSFLALLLSLRRHGYSVELFNTSIDVRHKLQMLNIMKFFTVRPV